MGETVIALLSVSPHHRLTHSPDHFSRLIGESFGISKTFGGKDMHDISETIEFVKTLMENNDYDHAIETLKKLELTADRDVIDYYLGLCYCKIAEMEKGIACFHNSANFADSEYAFRSYNNLAALYKRKERVEDHRIAFDYLEEALRLTEKLNLTKEKENIYKKIVRYLIELHFFDKFDNLYLTIDWEKFYQQLPTAIAPKNNMEKQGFISLMLAIMYWHREEDFSRVRDQLTQAREAFREDLSMMTYIAKLQNEIIDDTIQAASKAELQTGYPNAQEDLERLYEVGKAMNSLLDLDKLLTFIVDNVIEVTDAERGFLMLADSGTSLDFRIARNYKKDTLSQEDFVISRTIVEQVAETGEPILVANIEEEGSWIFTQSVIDLQLKSVLCVPLKIDERLLGVIYVDNSIKRSQFDERALNLLTTLSSNAAIAIENASLYRNLEQKKKYLENLLVSTKEMSTTNSILAAISIATHHIMDAILPFHHTTPYLYLFQEEDDPIAYRFQDGAFRIAADEEQISELDAGTEWRIKNAVLSVPIWRGETQLGVLNFRGLPRRHIRHEDKYFIIGLMNSLSLVLENLKREEEKQMALIGQMASGIIHDLKNPISILRGYADYLLNFSDKCDKDYQDRVLKSILKQSDYMIQMVNDILDFARGEMEMNIQEYSIREHIQNTVAYLEKSLTERNIQLDLQFDFDGEVAIDVDRFKRVILNLMKNAFEAIGKDGRIWINVRKTDSNILINIANDGPPIPRDVQKHLFRPFVTYGKVGGTGLGMAIVKKIVEEHGGQITFQSNDEETEFTIALPQSNHPKS
jgi:signal transduction histidine kinase/tetratricopeptide (TPR) repeat protein